ncbi:MAG: permease-like cell division protein FtsX [Ruminococcus sp.]|nr:permease-like cell division protein FtsX [Ruminococcus sp.]
MKLSGFKYLADQGVENIWKNKMMTFATFCVLLISLILVGASVLFYVNMNSMIVGLGAQNEIAVLLDVGTSDEQIADIERSIKRLDNVDTVEFRSKEYALASQRSKYPNAEQIFNEYIGDDASFMPDGFSVTVTNNDRIDDTSAKILAISHVQSATSSPQLAEFLRELRKVVSIIAGAIVLALAVVSMIMISNTTKASVFARREEIQIMKYVGATNAFIRMPFFVEGMITGFVAGVGGFFITWAVYRSIYNVMKGQTYLMTVLGIDSIIPFGQIRIYVLISYIVAGALVGALGSVISTRKHIDV